MTLTTSTSLPQVIGISGYARSGKTTVGRLIAEKTRINVHHLADPIRDLVKRIDPYDSDGILLSTRLEIGGEEHAKQTHDRYRHTLREVGEGVREILPSIWIAALADRATGAPAVVVPDVRRPFEADQCAIVINVTRPGIVSDGHCTEIDMSGYATHHIRNDGTLVDLELKVDALVADLGLEPNEY